MPAKTPPAALRPAPQDNAPAKSGRRSRSVEIPIRDRLLLPRKLAAAALSVSVRMLDELTTAGKLPSVAIGHRKLYRRADLQKFVERLGSA